MEVAFEITTEIAPVELGGAGDATVGEGRGVAGGDVDVVALLVVLGLLAGAGGVEEGVGYVDVGGGGGCGGAGLWGGLLCSGGHAAGLHIDCEVKNVCLVSVTVDVDVLWDMFVGCICEKLILRVDPACYCLPVWPDVHG